MFDPQLENDHGEARVSRFISVIPIQTKRS